MTHDPWWRHRHELRCSPDPAWLDRCSAWLQRPRGDLGPAAWLVLLQPQHHDADLRLPDATLHTACLLDWSAAVTAIPFDVVIAPAWAATRGGSTELAIDVRARRDDEDIASCRGIYRMPGIHASFGERDEVDRPPEPLATRRGARLTLDAGQVEAFASISNMRHPVNEDPSYARQRGFPGVLVQGPLLAATVMHHARPGSSGTARFWFRRPVSAGTLLGLESADTGHGRTRWWARKATGDVVAAAEIRGDAHPLNERLRQGTVSPAGR